MPDGLQIQCKDCKKEMNARNNPRHNKINNKMRKFRDQKLPLVYIITNKAWPGWFKVGYSGNWYTRKNSYQTATPFKDFEEIWRLESDDAKLVEKLYHDHLNTGKPNGEWVNKPLETIIEELELLHEEVRSGVTN